jgi:hypothetical protein
MIGTESKPFPWEKQLMSVSAVPSSAFFTPQNIQTTFQKFQQEFQQLGQDLQSGSLSAAQSDFASLKNLGAQSWTTTSQNIQSHRPSLQPTGQGSSVRQPFCRSAGL